MRKTKEPGWISADEVLAIHEELLALYGGSPGLRDIGLLLSALDRAKNLFAYENEDIFSMAAAYADGIVNNHPFVDGNNRTGFLVAALFLEYNGYEFQAPEEEVVTMIEGLAKKTVLVTDLAKWLKAASKRT